MCVCVCGTVSDEATRQLPNAFVCQCIFFVHTKVYPNSIIFIKSATHTAAGNTPLHAISAHVHVRQRLRIRRLLKIKILKTKRKSATHHANHRTTQSRRTCTFVNACVSDGYFTTDMFGSDGTDPWSARWLFFFSSCNSFTACTNPRYLNPKPLTLNPKP